VICKQSIAMIDMDDRALPCCNLLVGDATIQHVVCFVCVSSTWLSLLPQWLHIHAFALLLLSDHLRSAFWLIDL
jgi:hypothetical protein